MIWGYLIHLSFNMWCDRAANQTWSKYSEARPYLRCDKSLWDDMVVRLRDAGANMLVIDLGDAVRYASHPEIAVRKAWSTDKLRRELARLRKAGLEPIPKLNFSTCHDTWLGPYARMVSTDAYYQVCSDLLRETIDLFDKPRFFHLGMDEETAEHQRFHAYAVMRQHELWWHDLNFLLREVSSRGVRPWLWSDYIWGHGDEFLKNMPKSVLQSNWYYGNAFTPRVGYVRAYLDLEQHGYDQVPTGSNWSVESNFEQTVKYLNRRIAPERLKGFLQTSWQPTLEECRDLHMKAIECLKRGRELVE